MQGVYIRFLSLSVRLAICHYIYLCLTCLVQSSDVCSLEPEVGTCKGNIPRLFYNSTSNQCEKFFYGGCGGNGNNFNTLDECLQQCRELLRAIVMTCGLNYLNICCHWM